jgi:hypothetical protein
LKQAIGSPELSPKGGREGLSSGDVRGPEPQPKGIRQKLDSNDRLPRSRTSAHENRRTAAARLEPLDLRQDRVVGLPLVIDEVPAVVGPYDAFQVLEDEPGRPEAAPGHAIEDPGSVPVADPGSDELGQVVDVLPDEQGTPAQESVEAGLAQRAGIRCF